MILHSSGYKINTKDKMSTENPILKYLPLQLYSCKSYKKVGNFLKIIILFILIFSTIIFHKFKFLCLFYDNVLIINFRKCPNNKIS